MLPWIQKQWWVQRRGRKPHSGREQATCIRYGVHQEWSVPKVWSEKEFSATQRAWCCQSQQCNGNKNSRKVETPQRIDMLTTKQPACNTEKWCTENIKAKIFTLKWPPLVANSKVSCLAELWSNSEINVPEYMFIVVVFWFMIAVLCSDLFCAPQTIFC